ncbi:MAG: ornithine cyclodeaminase family protein [Promethearchaeota archaeon]|jgi:alanine dehydrogenase
MSIRLLTRNDIESLLSMEDAIKAVEDAFRIKNMSESSVKAWLFFTEHGGDLACWSTYIRPLGASGMKAIGYNTRNPKRNIPTITAVIILHDPVTSAPIAILDGTSLTALRTGAAAAVAAKYLARKQSTTAAIIGAGVQGRTQLLGLDVVLNLEEARIYDISNEAVKNYIESMEEKLDLHLIPFSSAKQAIIDADIIATATPSKEPIVFPEWLKPGVHINAMGADELGKQEIHSEVIQGAKIVVDDIEDTIRRGEINVPIKEGVISRKNIHAELMELVTGLKPGRENNHEITVFDGAGVAIEDIAVAWAAYQIAEEKEAGLQINMY